MALMLPPTVSRAGIVKPLTVDRRFRVQTRCPHCRREAIVNVEMLDEIEEPATIDDFYASGAHQHLDPFCERCGDEGITITNVAYMRGPIDT